MKIQRNFSQAFVNGYGFEFSVKPAKKNITLNSYRGN